MPIANMKTEHVLHANMESRPVRMYDAGIQNTDTVKARNLPGRGGKHNCRLNAISNEEAERKE
jgi:hypothetical protein